MVNTRAQAIKNAMAARTNVPGSCQKTVRGWFNAPSAGDQDGDGDADAVDGWKSEPVTARHADRNPPAGVPVAYSGGSHGYGHRALSLGNGKIRTTDGNGNGKVATQDLDWPEKHWGLKYLGWSDTIDGQPIPVPVTVDEKPVAKPNPVTYGLDISHFQRGFNVAAAMKQGYSFFIFKCTEGSTVVDAEYAGFIEQVKAAGALTMAYHFLHKGNAASQANNLAAHIGDKTIPVMVDVEKGGGASWADVRAFTAECKKRGITVALNYLPKSYWQQIGSPSLKGTGVLLNAAYPSSKVGYGSVLYPGNKDAHWASYGGVVPKFWQFTSSGKVDGYKGKVDVDAFRGSLADLKKLGLFKDYSATTTPITPASPKPEPKPDPTPPLVVSVVSANIKSNPAMSQVKVASDISKVAKLPQSGARVWFGQEIVKGRYRNAWVDAMMPAFTYCSEQECPISLEGNPKTLAAGGDWTGIESTVAKMHNGLLHVTPARYLSVVQAVSTARPDIKVAFVNSHFISGGWSNNFPATKKWRRARWSSHWVQMQDTVTRLHDLGYTVIAGADTNRTAMPPLHAGQIIPVEHGIDHLWVIPADGRTVKVTGRDVLGGLNTDHNAISATLEID